MNLQNKALPEKLEFNTDGKVNEDSIVKTPEENKQWQDNLLREITAWIEKLKNENK